MRILKRYFVPGADWEPITFDDFLTFTEESWGSRYAPGEAERLILSGEIVKTQFAEYKLERATEPKNG